MTDFIAGVFENYSHIIIYVHIISVMLFLGGLFSVRFLLFNAVDGIKDDNERYGTWLKILKRFLQFSFIMLSVIIIVSVLMGIGLGVEYGDPMAYAFIHAKGLLWILIAFNIIYMYIKYQNAFTAFKNNSSVETNENIILIVKYLIPLDLVLGLIATYLGIVVKSL